MPVFVKVTFWGELVVKTTWVANVSVAGESWTPGWVPTPVSETVCGLAAPLSVTVRVPLWVPGAVGVKVTEIVQLPLPVNPLSHVLVCAYGPLVVMELMLSDPFALSVTTCGALVDPTATLPKFRLVGLRVTTVTPVPESDTD